PGKWPAAALYVLLTLLLTYPLSLKPDRTVLAHYPDDELLMWVLAWDAHAFVHQPLSMFDANIFYPQRLTLAYSENLIGSAVFAAPVLWWTGNPVLALNVVALLACVLCGLGAYILGCRIGLSMPGADMRAHFRVLAGALLPHSSDPHRDGPLDSFRAGVAARVLRWEPQA